MSSSKMRTFLSARLCKFSLIIQRKIFALILRVLINEHIAMSAESSKSDRAVGDAYMITFFSRGATKISRT